MNLFIASLCKSAQRRDMSRLETFERRPSAQGTGNSSIGGSARVRPYVTQVEWCLMYTISLESEVGYSVTWRVGTIPMASCDSGMNAGRLVSWPMLLEELHQTDGSAF